MNADSVALAFVAAINEQKIVKMSEMMTPDHVFIDSDGGEYPGHDEMCKGWMDYFSMVPDYRIDVKETFVRDDIVVLIGTATGTFAENGEIKKKNRWSAPVALRAVVSGDRIAVWQVYVNPEPLREILNRIEAG